jgi:hypothetical protein
MSERQSGAPGSGRWHFMAVLLVTALVMVLGVLVVYAPDRMGVPDFTPTQVATPAATPFP